jgi:predicted O-methyltransferase YrrM
MARLDSSTNEIQSSSGETLSRALRVLREEGPRAVVSRTISALESIRASRRCAAHLRCLPEDMPVSSLLDFCYSETIRPWQVRSEIEALANIVTQYRPRIVLEIGTARGGTLFLWARLSRPDATIISVDLPGGLFGGGYAVWLMSLYRRFALPGQSLHLVRNDSHKLETAERVKKLLGERVVDFLFIDGDHTYSGVKRDFETYSRLVRKGGMVALHDIARRLHQNRGDVQGFWDEIKQRYPHRELIADPHQGWAGIGVLDL